MISESARLYRSQDSTAGRAGETLVLTGPLILLACGAARMGKGEIGKFRLETDTQIFVGPEIAALVREWFAPDAWT